jgi:hypothetical protein
MGYGVLQLGLSGGLTWHSVYRSSSRTDEARKNTTIMRSNNVAPGKFQRNAFH